MHPSRQHSIDRTLEQADKRIRERRKAGDYGHADAENGLRLIDAYGEDLLYVKGRSNPWLVWTGNCWERDSRFRAERLMEQTLRDRLDHLRCPAHHFRQVGRLEPEPRFLMQSLSHSRIAGALDAASHRVSVTNDVFDTNPWWLPCDNGMTYDLSTGRLRASQRDDYMTVALPVCALDVRDRAEPHPRWDAFLALLMGHDAEMVRYLRQCLGLLLTGDVSEKCFWFWVGRTNAGKTTLLTLMETLLGQFAYRIPLRALKLRGQPAIRHDLAGMQGKRLVFCEEFKVGDELDPSIIKEITGGGSLTADRKGEADETFTVRAKLIIGTNEMPDLRDIDDAIRGRVRVLPFTVDIPALLKERGEPLRSVDEVVEELIAGEGVGILQDLVAAVGEWQAAGSKLVMPRKVHEATRVYLDEQDPLVAWMQECCIAADRGTAPAEGAARRPTEERPFLEWYWSFRAQSGRPASRASTQWFGKQLDRHGFTKRNTAKGPRYTGPKLNDLAEKVMREAVAEAAWEDERRRWTMSSSQV